jgi:hypothetical protein
LRKLAAINRDDASLYAAINFANARAGSFAGKMNRYVGKLQPMTGVFPGYPA